MSQGGSQTGDTCQVFGTGTLATLLGTALNDVHQGETTAAVQSAHALGAVELVTGQAQHVDVVVLAGYMRVVKPKLLAAFPNRVLNIHPAILPSFPGIAGWKQALDYGAKVAGCTVHFVNAGIDSGPIIVQRVVDVMDNDSPETLHARIQVEEHIAYPEAIRLLASHALHISGRKVIRL